MNEGPIGGQLQSGAPLVSGNTVSDAGAPAPVTSPVALPNPANQTTPTPTVPDSSLPTIEASNGIAVAPASGESAADAAVREKIQNSFSDQVEVNPDRSGTTGVITPVFKDGKGAGFIYVMVPVKEDKSGQATAQN